MTRDRSVLVTGANGFIGRHLVRRLLADGCEVALLQRSPDAVDGRSELLRIEAFSPKLITAALTGRRFDWVLHLAAYGVRPQDRDVEAMFRVNVEATRHLVELAGAWSPRAVVIAGSGSEYDLGNVEEPVLEDQPLESFKLYGASKAAGTLCATAVARARGIPLAVCRLFGPYGPGEPPHRLTSSLVRALRVPNRIPLSQGLQKRDFLFVSDVVEALVKIAWVLEAEPQQVILNVGTGEPISVREFAERVAAAAGVSFERLGFGEKPLRPDETKLFSGNPAKLRAFAGWQPAVPLDEGIRQCLEYGADLR
jgi:UDP-glucose 4-epimerase